MFNCYEMRPKKLSNFSQVKDYYYISFNLKTIECYWGDKLQTWAERQGLKIVADRHLSRVVQAAYLLAAAKHEGRILNHCQGLLQAQLAATAQRRRRARPAVALPNSRKRVLVRGNERSVRRLDRVPRLLAEGQPLQSMAEQEPARELDVLLVRADMGSTRTKPTTAELRVFSYV